MHLKHQREGPLIAAKVENVSERVLQFKIYPPNGSPRYVWIVKACLRAVEQHLAVVSLQLFC